MWKITKAHLAAYCRNSGLHGLQYLSDQQRPLAERVLWAIAFVLSVSTSVLLIHQAWIKWDESPVIVSFEDHLRPIWQLPFPAVTICPERKFKESPLKFLDIEHRMNIGIVTETEKQYLMTRELVCAMDTNRWKNVTALDFVIDIIEQNSPNIEESLGNLVWQSGIGKRYYESEFFRPLLTEDGLCFSSNMLPGGDLFPSETFHRSRQYLDYNWSASDWNLDEGYSQTAGVQTYPQRTLGVGTMAGLTVTLMVQQTDLNLDALCNGPVYGFKVHIHNPADLPRKDQQFIRVPLSQAVEVTATPSLMTTSHLLKNHAPFRRQCYFSRERKLRFFKVYTQQNCATECLVNFTLIKCGCVAFYMPRLQGTPLCGPSTARCYRDVANQLLELEVQKGLSSRESRPNCDCLQSCTDLQYHTEHSQTDYDWGTVRPQMTENMSLSTVSIFFTNPMFLGSRRSEMYGLTDVLANCGGLLGLGVGFSVLSLVELLYWLVVRIWCSPRGPVQTSRRTKLWTTPKIFPSLYGNPYPTPIF